MLTRKLLWVDCIGAVLAGVAMLSLSSRLAELYGFPETYVVAMGIANLSYGSFSLSLATRRRRPLSLIVLLAAANVAWALVCFGAAGYLAPAASPFGLAHLIGEGLWVGGLGVIEWSRRRQLVAAS